MKIEDIARITHEANRAYCIGLGDTSQPRWEDAPDWQKSSAILGVSAILSGASRTPEDSHKSWLAVKEADGWTYGPVKNADLKQHPCFVPYDQLPLEQKLKDSLFASVVYATSAIAEQLEVNSPDVGLGQA